MKIRVDLSKCIKDESYDVIIDSGIFGTGTEKETLYEGEKIGRGKIEPHNENNELKDLSSTFNSIGVKGRVFVVTCKTVNNLYGRHLKKVLEKLGLKYTFIVLPDGEKVKSPEYLSQLYDDLVKNRFERSDFIIAFGGGVIGDLAGFAASTYLRGINLIQIPTTLLADVDSSVGGKTGINHSGGKNLIGSFYQPKCVIIDTDFLGTLDGRELKNGFSEVIKYGAILDKDLFQYLEENIAKILWADKESLVHIIQKSCGLKAYVVGRDEKESGFRSVLNFGHTLGHAVETLYDYKKIKHGEAVAIGMVFASLVSKELGLCNEETVKRLGNLIRNSELPAEIPPFKPEEYINVIKSDKKTSSNLIKFVLIKEIGEFSFQELDFDYLYNFLKKL